VLLVRMLFCFSIIYRLVFGGDCISPPFFCIYINGDKFIYCNTLAYMLNIFYICIPIYSSRTDRYYV
jgi:hypothetical protein